MIELIGTCRRMVLNVGLNVTIKAVIKGIMRMGMKLNGNLLKSAIMPDNDHAATKIIHPISDTSIRILSFFLSDSDHDVFPIPTDRYFKRYEK